MTTNTRRAASPRVEARRSAAQLRQAAYDTLTTQQKLTRLNDTVGPTGATRQRTRLLAKLAKENLAVVQKAEKAKK